MNAFAPTPDQPLWKQIATGEATGRVRKVITAYMAAEATIEMGKRALHMARDRISYKISIPSDDEIYPLVRMWVTLQIPERRLRSLTAQVRRSEKEDDDVSDERPLELQMHYDGKSEIRVELNGQRVSVAIERDDIDPFVRMFNRRNGSEADLKERVVFTTFGTAGRNAVRSLLEQITEEHGKTERTPRFHLAERWGNWRRRPDLYTRRLDSVVLREGLKEELVDDVARFLEERSDYERLGIPYHRGYLLHGPPGTGKTTLAKAVASHFALDVYYLPLSDIEDDTNLLNMIAGVKPRSMLVLEDIDVVHAATSRSDEKPGITLSGLLNSLDGLATPQGLITFMTTNHIEEIDEALIRPGRIDRVECIDYLGDEQLHRLMKVFCGFDDRIPKLNSAVVTPAEVAEVVKRHLRDDDNAVRKGLRELISRKSDGGR